MDARLETINNAIIDTQYRERLAGVLCEPIYVNAAEYTRGRKAPPTPLDPDNVYFNGLADNRGWTIHQEHSTTYREYAINSGMAANGFVMDISSINAEVGEWYGAEVIAQVNNRCDHNSAALTRLAEALTHRPADDTILGIVKAARCGRADLPSLVRLIKEYPEMVSIETSHYRRPMSGNGDYNPVRAAYEAASNLAATFADAEVTLGKTEPPKVLESELVPAVKTRKSVIATIASIDSNTQMVLKETFSEVDGREVILGVTTYLRTSDHRERPGYSPEYAPEGELPLDEIQSLMNMPPEQARQLLGSLATREP